MLKCYELLTEYMENPIGIDGIPAFSWKLQSDNDNVLQTAYRIIVEGAWDSGRVSSDKSTYVEYEGEKLLPETKYSVKVMVWDNHEEKSDWIEGTFETGLTDTSLWQAKWLTPENKNDVVPVLSKEINVSGTVRNARIYASAYGLYEIYINGRKLSDRLLTPGFTSYKKRLQYQTYEAEDYLAEGRNVIEIYLAKGWCTGRYPFQGGINPYNMEPSVIMQMKVVTDAGEFIAVTDETWSCAESKLRFSEIYDGEIFDNSFCDTVPVSYSISEHGCKNLIAQVNEPVRVVETLQPVELIKTPKGETVIDFGQNMTGWVCFKVKGKCGDRVKLSHAEVLDKDGNFYTENLRTAKQNIEYILSGSGEENYHSRMSFQGFRYVRVDEFPEEVTKDKFSACVICSDMKRIGSFECSDKLINRLYHNVIWGHKGNFVDIPTDCPQRDERVGWTGDAQVFCKTAAQNMDTALFFKKWLGDMRADQTEEGATLIFVPSMNETLTAAGWGDAATICPWEIYYAYGDERVLRTQYPAMKKWVEYIKAQGDNPYLWNTGFQLGDWLALDCREDKRDGMTSKDFIASAYYALSCKILTDSAKVLGYVEDAREYSDLYEKIKENIAYEFITPSGRMSDNTQTANVLALKFGIATNPKRNAETLNRLVEENGNKLTTGFLGTPYLLDALYENGYVEKAYDLLLQQEYPSWLFSVNQGATTIWEHWDGIKPDGSFWSDSMNSYNHYAYGSVADFMYTKVGGITPIEAGYKRIRIQPAIDKRLSFAKTSIETVYGTVSAAWKTEGNKFTLNITVPCNTTAEIIMPDGTEYELGSGSYSCSTEL
ncbi:MAG: family 78 glycoside hydrolase catalytic domain [Clostridia bacterium]|nr:family 78 glycoside hydrolase catalytic domain [Clostridia bacterium]